METVKIGALIQSGLREAFEQAAQEFHANLIISGKGPYQVYLEIDAEKVEAFREKMNSTACGAISWSE